MDQLAPEDEALIDFVNGKGNAAKVALMIIAGYLIFSEPAKAKLQELKGAVHEWNKDNNGKTDKA